MGFYQSQVNSVLSSALSQAYMTKRISAETKKPEQPEQAVENKLMSKLSEKEQAAQQRVIANIEQRRNQKMGTEEHLQMLKVFAEGPQKNPDGVGYDKEDSKLYTEWQKEAMI